MTDMTLTAYRDAIDYLGYFRDTVGSMIDWPGSGAHLSKLIIEERSGKVKGVRINCRGDYAGDPTREFVQVDVPRMHPLFIVGDDPLEITGYFDECWVVDRYAGYKDKSADEAQNAYGNMLLLQIAEDSIGVKEWGKIPEWRLSQTTVSLLVVDRTRKDLDVRKVKALCKLIKERVVPLLSDDSEMGREAVLDALTPEALEEFI